MKIGPYREREKVGHIVNDADGLRYRDITFVVMSGMGSSFAN